ncbi:MAG: Soluble lytic murein transglycosylase and related regulatory protein [Acidobacteria bacterium]|nr:Soluble lytic murein transglycosylase and related regulatory protein [Acidobacteriota bacterium]
MSRKRLVLVAAVSAVLVALIVFAVVLSRQRLRRHRVFRLAPAAKEPVRKVVGIPPVEEWTARFQHLPADDLAELLEEIEAKQPDLYAKWQLGYLHARTLLETNELGDAEKKLAPYLANGNPFRDLALFHQAELDEARNEPAAASRDRNALIFGYPSSIYRDQTIDDETEYLAGLPDPKPLVDFATKLFPSADTARRRDFNARIVESLLRSGDVNGALTKGPGLLQGGTLDDASDRVSRALDRPEILKRMTAAQWAQMGLTFQNHRHFDRAVVLLTMALNAGGGKRDDLLFAIGRSWFGNEKYAEAQQTYLRGANTTVDLRMKSQFLWHAARAAQLLNDDAGAERLMAASIAVPVKSPSAVAALTQRIRTRMKQHRVAEATADLQQLRKASPNEHAIVEGSLAYAVAMVAAGNNAAALSTLNAIPPKLLDKWDRPELAYWRARVLEPTDPRASFAAYLTVLRSEVPTHFAYFARQRLDAPAMAAKVAQEVAARDAQAAQFVASRNFLAAKQIATDRVLLSSRDPKALQTLTSIYRQLPPYRMVLDLQPAELPHFPTAPADRPSLLMAMGLFDEATDAAIRRYPLRPLTSALTQSLVLNRGNASKPSIYAIEVLMKSVPNDFVPELLPVAVRELLYPRYFINYIDEDAKKYGTDPFLLLSIMREESRFDPRAKSEAAARGLLQFIITTAREIGRDVGLVDLAPEELYDPRVIIRLGARYVATLSKDFAADRYKVAAAYNAGPKQTALWSRLAPAAGDDFFLSSINFDETKDYVRKVLNSYKRYGEIYGNAGPQGGLRAEP